MEKNHKIFGFLLVGILILTAVASCRTANQNYAYDSIRIGVVLPLSGTYEIDGKASLEGMQLAVDECNKRGGVNNRKVILIVRNTGSDESRSAALMRELILENNVVACIGGYSSSEALRLRETAEELAVPFIAHNSTSTDITDDASYTFQSCFDDDTQGVAMGWYLYYHGHFKKIGIMLNVDSKAVYARDLSRKIGQSYTSFGGKTPVIFSYMDGDGSFASQIKQFIYEDVEAIVFPGYPNKAKTFIREARQLGFGGTLVGVDSYDSFEIYKDDFNWGNCIYSTGYAPEIDSERNRKFVEKIQKITGRLPGYSEAMGYDGINMLLKSCNEAYSPEMIAFNLRYLKTYNSVLGELYVNENGRIIRPTFIIKKVNKTPKLLETISSEKLRKLVKADD